MVPRGGLDISPSKYSKINGLQRRLISRLYHPNVLLSTCTRQAAPLRGTMFPPDADSVCRKVVETKRTKGRCPVLAKANFLRAFDFLRDARSGLPISRTNLERSP